MPAASGTTDFEQPRTAMSTSVIQGTVPTTEQQDSRETTMMTINKVNLSNTGASVALITVLIGGVAGALLFVFISTLIPLSLVLVWMIKKHKLRIAVNKAQYHLDHHQEPQLEGSEQTSTVRSNIKMMETWR